MDAGQRPHHTSPGRWRARPILDLITRYQMPAITGVAPQIALLLNLPDITEHDFDHVKAIVVGGAASPPLVEEARRVFGAPYSIRYSSTESGGIGIGTALDADDDEALHSIGRPRPGVEADIRDEDGTSLPDGEVGELWLTSPAVMSGYWNDPAGTAETLVDGWLRTGDLATRDDKGIFRLRGRVKEMFVRGGYNVYPMEVEGVLLDHSGVAEIALVPRPDPVMGEIGVAVIVPVDRGATDARRSPSPRGGDARPSQTAGGDPCRRRTPAKRKRQDRPTRACSVEPSTRRPNVAGARHPSPAGPAALPVSGDCRVRRRVREKVEPASPAGRRYRSQPALRSRVHPGVHNPGTGSARRVRRGLRRRDRQHVRPPRARACGFRAYRGSSRHHREDGSAAGSGRVTPFGITRPYLTHLKAFLADERIHDR